MRNMNLTVQSTMNVWEVMRGLGCAWSQDGLTKLDLIEEFGIHVDAGAPACGWYSTKTDTVLVLGNEEECRYDVFVWNEPNAREKVLRGISTLMSFVNLPVK